jgi:hypothetical protein
MRIAKRHKIRNVLVTIFCVVPEIISVRSDRYLSARAEDGGLSHVEKIFQQKNTFAEIIIRDPRYKKII